MNLSDYQRLAQRTMRQTPTLCHDLSIAGLGITGEAGEVADYLKKVLGHGHELDTEKLARELGDVLWYVAAIATLTKLDLADVAMWNIQKLRERYPEGFTEADSKARRDVAP